MIRESQFELLDRTQQVRLFCKKFQLPYLENSVGVERRIVIRSSEIGDPPINLIRMTTFISSIFGYAPVEVSYSLFGSVWYITDFDLPDYCDLERLEAPDEDAGYHLIVSAGGQATRIEDLAHGQPKHLLDVHGQPLLTRNLALLNQGRVRRASVTINSDNPVHRDAFTQWASSYGDDPPILVASPERHRSRDALITLLMQDIRFGILVHGDRLFEESQPGAVVDFFDSVREDIHLYPFCVIGKRSTSEGRGQISYHLNSYGQITEVIHNEVTPCSDNVTRIYIAFWIIDGCRVPVDLDHAPINHQC
jgi:hypothetical protein